MFRFWLSVAALALVRDRSWLALSEKWNDVRTPNKEPITLCENHDDGTTPAQVCAITASFFALDFLEILEITNNAPYQTQRLNEEANSLLILNVNIQCAESSKSNARSRIGKFHPCALVEIHTLSL